MKEPVDEEVPDVLRGIVVELRRFAGGSSEVDGNLARSGTEGERKDVGGPRLSLVAAVERF